jgi:hypothetical protein
MNTRNYPEVANASNVYASLDQFKAELQAIAASQNVSITLLLTILHDWTGRQLRCDL